MNPFFCAVDLHGASVGADALTSALPALTAADGRIEYLLDGCWGAAWVPSAAFGRPGMVRHHELLAIGAVRLDRRASGVRSEAAGADTMTDLEIVAATFRREGARGLRGLVGEFAVALWDTRRHVLLAVRDALGVRPLYYAQHGARLTIASHLECFDRSDIDREYLRRFVVGDQRLAELTPYANVRPIQPGSWLVADGQQVRSERYWHPAEFAPAATVSDVGDTVAEFRALFADAVAAQVADGRPAWSQLSGGLDSSSIVGMVSHLGRDGRAPALAGTVTLVDSLSDGDETRFSDAVGDRWGVPNHRLTDFWAWQSDDLGPSGLGAPRHFLPFFARDREMCRQVRQGGGEVLLSGYGGDQYLSGGFEFITDRIAAGEHWRAVNNLVELAVTTRQSFWSQAWTHGLEPLAPRWLRRPPASGPDWVRAADVAAPPVEFDTGSRFGDRVASETAATELMLNRGPFELGLEVRYPFLHRPLVEFGLGLPVDLRVRPGCQKWILRQAVRDLLPAQVANRAGKGGIDGRVLWSLNRERSLLRRLIADSHLAELGLVDREALSTAFERTRRGDAPSASHLFFTLSLETWLAVQSGWWARHAMANPAAGNEPVASPSSPEQYHAEAAVR